MGDSQITEEKAEYGLHIRHIHRLYHTRYGYKRNSGDSGTNHGKAPIIPKATTYHGDWFSPLKNAAFEPPFRPVIRAISKRMAK